METPRIIKVGFRVPNHALASKEILLAHLTYKGNYHGRMLLTLREYFLKYSNKFKGVDLHFTDKIDGQFSNGTLTGTGGQVNRSEVDIGARIITMNDFTTETVDFSYPYKLHSTTFVIHQPEYKPHILGILQTFSLSIWLTVICALIFMSLIYYIHLKPKHTLNKILLHVLAILLRQSSIVRPSSSSDKLLLYSWVIGAMFLCLAYDSVFLSFMAFPPVIPIKDLSDLATAVKNGQYHCFTVPKAGFYNLLLRSEQESVRVIAKDILSNNIRYEDVLWDFLFERKKLQLAFIIDENNVHYMNVGKKFISKDRFLETMPAMMVRRNFCCKEVLNTFVHRLMASGLYFKYHSDTEFVLRLHLLLSMHENNESNKRKITLTDVAPAFIFLLSGYFISFIVLIREIICDRKRKMKCVKKMNNKK